MKLRPSPPDIPLIGGFTTKNDLFELKPFAEQLTNLAQNLEQPLVLLIDSPWGSGKSTFCRQWAGLLRSRGMHVIYFDAFEHDHQDDAFTVLAGEILSSSGKVGSAKIKEAFVDSAKKVGAALLPFAVKAAVRVGTMGILSGDSLDGLGEELKEVVSGSLDDGAAVTEELIKEKLSNAEEERKHLEHFKAKLSDLAQQLSTKEKTRSGPLIFIIDELDRCRPTFALNILERVKHLFAVEGICFVLVSHKKQLEAIVRGSYGNEFDAAIYLQKFFHLRVNLPSAAFEKRPKSLEKYITYVWNDLTPASNAKDQGYDNRTIAGLAALAVVHRLELRDIEHVMSDLMLFLAATTGKFRPDPLVVVLAIMKLRDLTLFERCVTGQVNWLEVKEFIRQSAWPESAVRAGWYEEWWQGTLDPNWNDKKGAEVSRAISQSINQYNFSDPKRALTWIASIMAEFRVSQPRNA